MMQSGEAVEGGGRADLSVVAGVGLVDSLETRNGTENGVQTISGDDQGQVSAMGGRGLGEKSSGAGMLNSTANEGGADQSQSQVATAMDDAVDEELKDNLKIQVLEITSKVEEMERQVIEVNRMRASLRKTKSLTAKSAVSTKDRDKVGLSNRKQQQQLDAAKRESARAKRMAELMRQLGTVLRQTTQHKWAWPFMEPVDVKGLGLNDYFEIIKKPMDLGTIRDRMDAKDAKDAKDGTSYKHIQEVCDDIRLVFSNAMTYNQVGTDVHVMAKTLSEKFEEKWKAVFEPKLQEEDLKRSQEDREANAKEAAALQAAEEEATEKLAGDVSRQMEDLDKQLEDLKQKATPRCRIMTIEEKRQLGHSLGRLPAENLQRVIQIIAQKNPGFNATADEVEVDIDAQEPATLWRLHRYVQSVTNLKARALAQSTPCGTKRDGVMTTEKLGAKRSRKMELPGSGLRK